jgi:hypothetical protein
VTDRIHNITEALQLSPASPRPEYFGQGKMPLGFHLFINTHGATPATGGSVFFYRYPKPEAGT